MNPPRCLDHDVTLRWLAYRSSAQLMGEIFHMFSGNPKGAMLTHENVVSDAAGVIKGFEVYRVTL